MAWLRWCRSTRQLDLTKADPATLHFPEDFAFGAATAAHQVEGGLTRNNWTQWERTTRSDGRPGIFTGDRVGQAADHWRRFEADLERMQDLGLGRYRFSLAWSRIEPEEGRFDDAAMARYRSWCVQLRDVGITPMVTLHHFTEPLWLTEQDGFASPKAVEAFARFVRYVVPRLADVVDDWVTINEPAVYAVLGWYRGEFPPGQHDPALAARVLDHLLLAHAEAYHLLHSLDTSDADGDGVACRASIAKNVVPFVPKRWWHAGDVALAYMLDQFYNEATLQALETGRFRVWLPGLVHYEATHSQLAGTWDYVGLNHYFRNLVALDLSAPDGIFLGFDGDRPTNDMGWSLYPQALYDALRTAGRFGKPIYITENGTCDAEQPDWRRQWFLTQSLYAVQQAMRDGVDVRGYCYWSLMDNFEWAHGFAPRFGLYRVDYATQQRTLTGGGRLYRDIIARQRQDITGLDSH